MRGVYGAATGGGREVVLADDPAGVLELQDALLHQSAGDQASDLIRLFESASLVHCKEVQLVFQDGTAHARAKTIVLPDAPRLARLIELPGIGVVSGVLVVFVPGAVPFIGATARRHFHRASRGARK